MTKQRLDKLVVSLGLASTRSQAENLIRLGKVRLNGQKMTKPGHLANSSDEIILDGGETYVSRAGLKLASVAKDLKLNFDGKNVLDVGSSTGGFTDYALKHGAKKIIAVDVGTNQMHPSLSSNVKVELHEKTDIRNYKISIMPDLVVVDVSFISLRQVLLPIASMSGPDSLIAAMAKPQFEAGKNEVNKGIIKNNSMRRKILSEFESWAKQYFVIIDKADSRVAGAGGNLERFYLLKKLL